MLNFLQIFPLVSKSWQKVFMHPEFLIYMVCTDWFKKKALQETNGLHMGCTFAYWIFSGLLVGWWEYSNLSTPMDNKSSRFLGTKASHQAEIVSSSSALLLMKLAGCCVLHSTMEEELCRFENVFLINKGAKMLFRYRGKYFVCVTLLKCLIGYWVN